MPAISTMPVPHRELQLRGDRGYDPLLQGPGQTPVGAPHGRDFYNAGTTP